METKMKNLDDFGRRVAKRLTEKISSDNMMKKLTLIGELKMEEQEGGFCCPSIEIDKKPLHVKIIETVTGKAYESERGGCLPTPTHFEWSAGKVKMTIEFLDEDNDKPLSELDYLDPAGKVYDAERT